MPDLTTGDLQDLMPLCAIGGACAFLNLGAGARTSTPSSSTAFLRGVRSRRVSAAARRLHVGRSTIARRTAITDDPGRLVAESRQSQAVLT